MLKKDYEFDEVFNIFDELDDNRCYFHKYNPRTSNVITKNNEMLEYLKISEWKLIDTSSTASVVEKKLNNASYKGYVNT